MSVTVPYQDDPAVRVAQRDRAAQEPAILAVEALDAQLDLVGTPGRDGVRPDLPVAELVGMEDREPPAAVAALQLVERVPVVRVPGCAMEIQDAVRPRAPDHAGDRVDDETQMIFGPRELLVRRLQRRVGAVLLTDVHHPRSKPIR